MPFSIEPNIVTQSDINNLASTIDGLQQDQVNIQNEIDTKQTAFESPYADYSVNVMHPDLPGFTLTKKISEILFDYQDIVADFLQANFLQLEVSSVTNVYSVTGGRDYDNPNLIKFRFLANPGNNFQGIDNLTDAWNDLSGWQNKYGIGIKSGPYSGLYQLSGNLQIGGSSLMDAFCIGTKFPYSSPPLTNVPLSEIVLLSNPL